MATIAQAAAHIFCSRSQFDQYLAEGAVTRQSSGTYDLDQVRREAFAHLRSVAAGRGGAAGSKLTEERTRLVAAKRRREERADAIEAGQVARVAPIQRYLERMIIAFRNRVLNLPGECAFLLANRDQAEIYEVLDEAIRSKLEELADPKTAAADAAAAGLAPDVAAAGIEGKSSVHQHHEAYDDEDEDHAPDMA
jgi:hypothetical protein